MSRVQVLLSTFNGERFLPALLDSLAGQTHPDVSVLVRDDGSGDGTTDVLERYASSGQLRWYQGHHVGIRASFFDLVARADASADLYAFCDQDDIWLPEKLERASAQLAEANGCPALYCARALLVDERLQAIGHTMRPARGPSLCNALVENIAPGCTMVFNAAARRLLIRETPHCQGLHDSWTYLVVAALGRVIFDDSPTVLYRQHGGNAIGARHQKWRWRLKRFGNINTDRALRTTFVAHAAELERIYGDDLDPVNRGIVSRFVHRRPGILDAVKYAVRGDVYRQTTVDNLILRTLIALRQI